MGIGVWCWGQRLLTLVHWSVSLWIRWNSGSSCSAEWWRSSLPTFFHLNLYYTPGSVLTAPGLAESDLWTNHLNFQSFTGYDLRLSMWFSSFQQAQARRWWMGSLKFAIGSRASFHPKSCRRPLQFLSFSSRCPRAAGSESLKCSFFTFPLREICFKMSVCSRSVFYWEVLRKWLRLEFLSPYLRLFSFCDYTIAHA